jgi:hypothetical protein
VRLSIEEVIHTLFEAIVLVVLVVYLFLQSVRTTLICAVAIVVALVSTFAGMLALGFSINLLTLFGLVLAIGLVVDDRRNRTSSASCTSTFRRRRRRSRAWARSPARSSRWCW